MGSVTDCNKAVLELLQFDTETSVKALDAFGKVPAGILVGNNAWWGDYDECITLDGLKYCLVSLQLNASALIQSVVLSPSYGVCVPDVCSEQDIINNIENLTSIPALSWLSLGQPSLADSYVQCQEFPQQQYDAGFVCFTIFCVILLLLMISGAALDIFERQKNRKRAKDHVPIENSSCRVVGSDGEIVSTEALDETKPLLGSGAKSYTLEIRSLPKEDIQSTPDSSGVFQELLLCFAFNRNLRKLMDTRQSDKTVGCLNGIRVISISWVILGHVFLMSLNVLPENMLSLADLVKHFLFQAVDNAFLSVDTFFFMSGFLVAYLGLSRMKEEKGRLSVGWFYFHRLWRLTPLYAFVIVFVIYFFPYFGSGPMWFKTADIGSICRTDWWKNLLYINNLFEIKEGLNELCIGWSWYLSNDMQFYVITPLLLIPIYRSQLIGLLIVIGIITANFIVTGVLIGYFDLTTTLYGTMFGMSRIANLIPGTDAGEKNSYFSIVYTKPYCRMAPYLVGFVMGYFVYRQVTQRREIRLSPVTVATGWALASAIGIAVVYGTYGGFQADILVDSFTTTENIFYGTFNKFAWSIAMAWLLFACHYGYGGWVNDLLSWSFWVPLSRLTYSAYLVHGLVVYAFYLSVPAPLHISLKFYSFIFCGILLLSYGAALLFSLAIEYPCGNLEKMLFRSTRKKQRITESTVDDVNREDTRDKI